MLAKHHPFWEVIMPSMITVAHLPFTKLSLPAPQGQPCLSSQSSPEAGPVTTPMLQVRSGGSERPCSSFRSHSTERQGGTRAELNHSPGSL